MNKKTLLKIGLIWTLFFAVLFLAAPALAQAPALDTGIDYAKATGLVDTDIRIIIARIINVALGLLGIVAVALVIWGGYEYMTAAGDEEQIGKAKKILFNAGIGLAIILSAYAITQFVISKLTDAIMAQYQEQVVNVPGEPTNCVGGQCYLNQAFYAEVEPKGNLLLKNIVVMVNFKEEPNLPAPVDPSTATLENIKVVKVISGAGTASESLEAAPYPGSLQIAPNSKGSTVEFHPTGSCAPEQPDTSICFEKNTTYKVTLSPNIKELQISGLLAKNLECNANHHVCTFYFTSGEKYDNTPPQATMVLPGNGANLKTDAVTTVSAAASDDTGLQGAVFHSSKEKVPFFNMAFDPYPLSVNADQLKYENFIPQLTDVSKKETWQLSVEVKDIAGHSTLAQQNVNILPEFCFNDKQDVDETGINCGPNCGACLNEDCGANADCASGYCDLPALKCVVKTKITNVEPKDGAVGNYVSIFGQGFGAFEAGKSQVIFLGDISATADDKPAIAVQCFNQISWQDSFIVIQVPAGAVSGPIKVISAASTGPNDLAHQDSTHDDFGPAFPVTQVFVINKTVKPGICGVNPSQAASKKSVTINGANFGATQGNSKVKFGDFNAGIFTNGWSEKSISAQVPPALPAQKLTIKTVVNNQSSNSVPFEVLAPVSGPYIDALDPFSGPKGSYLTVLGSGFGKEIGKVVFAKNGVTYNAEPLPNECGNSWSDSQIVVKVPTGESLTDGNASVKVIAHDGAISDNYEIYKIDLNKKQINFCKIAPDNGPVGQPVILYGEGFEPIGKKWGNVDFSPFDTFAESSSWSDKKIESKVPAKAQSGPVKVIVFGDNPPAPAFSIFPLESNSLKFKVQNCQDEITNKGQKLEEVCGEKQQCCPAGYCLDVAQSCVEGVSSKSSVFAWSFSPGKLPVVPEVLVACDEQNGKIIPSPTPSQKWKDSDQVCVNAEIKVRFTSLIDSGFVPGSVLVESCDNEACDNPAPVQGTIDYTLSNINFLDDWIDKTGDLSVVGMVQDTLTFKPTANNGLLEQNKWYRVTLTTDIKSEVLEAPLSSANMLPAAPGTCVDPVGKKASYCFKFKTQNSPDLCKLGSAIVNPDPFTAKDFDKVYKDLYNVTAISADNKCWSINASAYDWHWNAGNAPSDSGDPSIYAKVDNKQEVVGGVLKGKPKQSLITKDKETPAGGEKVWTKTASDNNDIKASSSLFISPKKPKITNWWPQCNAACPNAAIGAVFDMAMNPESFKSMVSLVDCGNGEKYNEEECGGASQVLSVKTSQDDLKLFVFTPSASFFLLPNHWYKVKLVSLDTFGIKSAGGSKLDSSSISSWHFRVKNDSSVCALDHVNIFPTSSTVYWIGDYSDYLALPFGAPDECSDKGQMLVADTYNWSWSAKEPKVAKIAQGTFDPTHGLFNSLASSTAVGNGDVNQATKQQVTQISTTADDKTSSPLADFILQCGFSPTDADCPLPNGGVNSNVGIGSNSCCYERPSAVLTQPFVSNNVCPNTAVIVDFTQPMATSTFTSSALGAYNIILAENNGTAACPVNTYQVAQEPASGFWQKVKNWFNVLLGRPAQAQIYCAGGVKYKIVVSGTFNGSTKASLLLEKPLTGGKTYQVIVTKDVKNLYGVSVDEPFIFPSFTTKVDICKIDNIKIDPSAWLFKTTKDDPESDGVETGDKDKIFSALAYYKNGAVPASPEQEIQSSEQYKWEYNWVSSDTSIVTINPADGAEITASVATPAKNGMVDIGANAKISFDQVQPGTVGKIFSATSTAQVFICENPWPSVIMHEQYGLGYVDAVGNSGNIVPPGQGWTNFKLMYCRDAGAPNDKNDDLPLLNSPTVLTHQIGAPLTADGTGIFKEFFASFAPANKNSIGLRVYANTDHLPLMDWYNSQKLTGAPAPTQVGQYKALQEGRTYYIDGVNSSVDAAGNTTLFSNVYVFSFSDNPTAETLNIVNQLLSNFTLNVNVDDKEIVAKMYRDYQRLQDLKLISEKLWGYYGKKGEYPKLTENPQLGTYLPAYTNSKWKSWQGVLGNLVGYTLPIDPLNGFKGCGDGGLGDFDAETCWNATNSTFVCPAGSRVYQYETTGGAEATLKSDFELPKYGWYKKLIDLKPIAICEQNSCQITSGECYIGGAACLKDSDCNGACKPIVKRCSADDEICSSDSDCALSFCDLNYQIGNNCNNVVEGASGKCGDGIVGSGETCELGAQQYIDCSVANYPGKQLQKCKIDCSAWESVGGCVPQGKCGDGVKQGAEKCDDGKNNGKYGYCKMDCLGTSAEFCGDGKVTFGKEVCDASAPAVLVGQPQGINGWCSANNNSFCATNNDLCGVKGNCISSGEKYNAQKDLSCSWDCQNWNYCGDGVVNQNIKEVGANKEEPYEQCEKSENCQVGVCDASNQLTSGKFCEKDSNCVIYQDVQVPLPQGGSKTVKQAQNPDAKCVDYKPGKKYCQVTGEKKYKKFFNSVGKPYFQDATTTAFIAPTSELSYTDSNKSCGWEKANVNLTDFATLDVSCLPIEIPPAPPSPSLCGNGKIEAGEVCDDGANNGVICTPIANAPTCTYCAYGCQQVITKTK